MANRSGSRNIHYLETYKRTHLRKLGITVKGEITLVIKANSQLSVITLKITPHSTMDMK